MKIIESLEIKRSKISEVLVEKFNKKTNKYFAKFNSFNNLILIDEKPTRFLESIRILFSQYKAKLKLINKKEALYHKKGSISDKEKRELLEIENIMGIKIIVRII